ncbi:hypothetical protein [Hufsiella ginkgonis]|uniref:Uncharacterized protein n=1 Tax=Hufsiella ginkgonis TaxID=2695274 RepID=A0A7K1Y174_9SPHI|nr:hypothetical protein [Hufsiella ginkgonis]MXV16867.1 hypothetical protein [Hufsiella ginkgonis]
MVFDEKDWAKCPLARQRRKEKLDMIVTLVVAGVAALGMILSLIFNI